LKKTGQGGGVDIMNTFFPLRCEKKMH
jgi:hypothetical protein